MSGQSPPIKNTQLTMLCTLLTKLGWTDQDFAQHADKTPDQLSQAEARRWITRLTNETRGKSLPQRRKQPAKPVKHAEKTEKAEKSAPQQAAVRSVPAASAEELAQACTLICQQLNLNPSNAEFIINKTLSEVGIKTGLHALEQVLIQRKQAKQTTPQVTGLWQLTPLELWVNVCRAFASI